MAGGFWRRADTIPVIAVGWCRARKGRPAGKSEPMSGKRETETETAAREYSRIYNRLKARKRRGRITTDAWNRQVARAQELKDAFTARQITREEYVQKLDAL